VSLATLVVWYEFSPFAKKVSGRTAHRRLWRVRSALLRR